MSHHHSKQDLYELKPTFIIVFGVIGMLNPWLVPSSVGYSLLGQICGLIMFASAAKIIHWRRMHRQKWM